MSKKSKFGRGEFKVEISYFEKTRKGLRFAKFKRFLEVVS